MEIAPGAHHFPGFLSIERQRAFADQLPRLDRRRGPRLRASCSRRRQDARQNALPWPSLERKDLSIRAHASRLRRAAGAAAASGVSSTRSRDRDPRGNEPQSRPVHPQLLRRRREDGVAPGQGRGPGVDCRGRSGGVGVDRRHGELSVRRCSGGATLSRRSRSNQEMRSSSAGPRGCATTASHA